MRRAAQEAEKTAARGRPATDPCNPSTQEAGVGRNKFRAILVYTAKSCERWEGREDREGGVAKLELKATLFKDPQISTASQGTDTDLSSKFVQENKKQKHKKLLMPRSEIENDPQPSKRQSLTLLILIIYKITDSHACAQKWQIPFLWAAGRIGANAKLGAVALVQRACVQYHTISTSFLCPLPPKPWQWSLPCVCSLSFQECPINGIHSTKPLGLTFHSSQIPRDNVFNLLWAWREYSSVLKPCIPL